MPTFVYKGRTTDGRIVEGTVESLDRSTAITMVENKHCVPLKVEPAKGETDVAPRPRAQKSSIGTDNRLAAEEPIKEVGRISQSQRLLFTEQLAYLLMTNMNLDQALGVLARRLKQPALSRLTRSLHQALVDGESFSQALSHFPRVFSSLYVNLAQAGEASGALSEVLTRLVKHLSDMKQVRDKVQQALIYPAFLALVGVGLVIIFITYMVPRLTELFKTAGGSLPWASRMLIGTHDVIFKYWWLGLIIIGLIYGAYRALVSSPNGRMTFDRMKLSVPGYGQVLRFRFFSQFARTTHTLLENGVNLLRAMELLEDIAENIFISEKVANARAMLLEGSSLSTALGRQQIFPGMYIDMLAVGEQAGRLAETMGMVAEIYERELDRRVKIASAMIPPVIIVVIALLVGMVVFGILSAVFNLTAGLKGA